MDKPAEFAPEQEATAGPAPVKKRAAWQSLGYEKLDFAEAQAGFANTGTDHGIYS